MTATCRDQYDELQRLNDQYNAACEQYGENSDAANSLRYQLDRLNDEFEANRQTVKEFVAECDGGLIGFLNNWPSHQLIRSKQFY